MFAIIGQAKRIVLIELYLIFSQIQIVVVLKGRFYESKQFDVFINDDFPDYKIINIEEIGLPIFKKDITCLATINKSLSDVLEFTLKLFDLGYSVETISKILALDKEIIRHAYYDLDSMDMLDMTTNKVTEEGRKYLEKNSYDTLKK